MVIGNGMQFFRLGDPDGGDRRVILIVRCACVTDVWGKERVVDSRSEGTCGRWVSTEMVINNQTKILMTGRICFISETSFQGAVYLIVYAR